MISTKNPFLTFRFLDSGESVGINIHNITSYSERKGCPDRETKDHVLVLCVDDRYGRSIDISFEEFERILNAWYELQRHPQR